jgi:trimeric autotransporter adhesin
MGSGTLKIRRKLVAQALFVGVFFLGALFASSTPAHAAAGINQEVNFQGRLLNSQGAVVPDGYYNMEFKIYEGGDGAEAGDTGGTLDWTENYLNSSSQGVEVQNGYMSVQLGSVNPFGSSINWNDDTLWLSMQVGDTSSCTISTDFQTDCGGDGEMVPMKRLSANAYALNSALLGGLSSAQFVQLGQGLQTDASGNTSIYLNKTGSGNIVDLQANGADAFTITGTGDQTFGANADHTLSVATAAADTAGSALTISSGAAGAGASALAGGDLTIAAGAGGGTNGNGGSIAIDAGAPNGSGSAGNITVGTNYATNITIGNTSTSSQAKVQAGSASATVTNSGGMAVKGATSDSSTDSFSVANSSNLKTAEFKDDGTVNLGAGAPTTMGYTTIGGTQDSGSANLINAGQYTAPSTGTIASLSVFIGNNVDGTNDHYQMALYADDGSNTPDTYIASTNVGTITANSWNTLPISDGTASVTSGTKYWISYWTDTANASDNSPNFDSGVVPNHYYAYTTGVTFGSGADNGMPATFPTPTSDASTSNYHSVYATFSDPGPALTISPTGSLTHYGAANFKDASASTTAFQVQNVAGDTVFTVDTSSNSSQGQVVLGKAGTNNGALEFQSSTAGGGYVALQAPSIASADSYSLVLPTAAPSGSGFCLQTSSASQLSFGSCGTTGSFINNQTSQQTGANFNIDGTGIAGTALETPTLDAASSGALNIGLASGGIATQINLNQNVQVSGDQTFTAGANRSVSVAAAASGNGNDLTITAGTGATGGNNGGNLILQGGAGTGSGTTGLVVLGTPTFSATTNDPNCYTGGALVASTCTVAQATVDTSSTVIVGFSTLGQTAYLPAPTNTTPGRVFYITAANGSLDFTLSVNGGGTGNEVSMRQNTSATMVWNGTAWGAAGASSSTDLQAAYDNTLQSAGGAELIVSHTSNTNGLTIRDSATNPVNGPLVAVQSNSAATLFSVNSNVTEYASDPGAEVEGGSSTTFPSSTWGVVGGATVGRYTTVGDYIATGQGSVQTQTSTTAGDGVSDTLDATLTANQHYNVTFAGRLSSGTFTDMYIYYSVDGSTQSVACTTTQQIITSVWTKINCSFTAPASGITSSNAILIGQTGTTARTFYIDNMSVTISADYNYATDGSVDDNTNFTTNWPSVGGATVTRSSSIGNDASDSAQVVTTGSNQGVANVLAVAPLESTLYRITVYVASTTSGFNNFTITYLPDGSTPIACGDYNTQTASSSTSNFTKVTCYLQTDTTTASAPKLTFTQTDSTGRTFYVDTLSITLATDTTPNVQVGGGPLGGPTTLFTLDSSAGAPIASDNESLLGSMYYDTSLGKIQCYEASGWGSCGSSPDTIVTISPEYTNAVMHGTGVGTMTSDFCSDTLNINDGSSSQPTICNTNETFNFYKWTSPQASAQTYSIYVTYQLPDTFKGFSSGQTSVLGRTDSTNSTVKYSVYRENSSTGLTQCGPTITVSTGAASDWQPGAAIGATDPATCGFGPGDLILFKIDMIANSAANAYVGNLNFTFSNN